jgi:uncharacterized protein (DUF927 family)
MDATMPINAAPEGEATERRDDAAPLPPGFTLRRDGIFWQPDDPEKPLVHVCGRLIAEARTHDGNGRAWGVLLCWLDREGREHKWAMPLAMLAGDGAAVREHLLDAGLFVGAGARARALLLDFLGRVEAPRMVRVVPRLGWHDTTAGRVFVLPDAALGAAGVERLMLQTERPDALPPLRQAGTLADWQREVAARAVGNTRLAFAIGASFAAPLLGLLGAEGGGFHLRGASSVGKSTALQAAGSVWGGGGLRGWVRSWRTTDNALEAVAAAHCDLLLGLDEMGEASPEAVAACAYALANGAGKGRAGRDGSARRIAEWRVLFLSTGEEGLADRLAEAKGAPCRVRAGQEVRVLDIPADTGRHGLFETLHGFPDARTLADALKAAAARCYGTAGRAWLEHLAADAEGCAVAAREVMDAFAATYVPPGASGQVHRGAQRFALVAAAGELAIGAGILPWPPGEAERAAAACFNAWLASRAAGKGAAEDTAAVAAVRRFLIQHGASRFETVGTDDEASGERVINRAGWKKRDGAGWRFIIPGEVWRGEVVAGLDSEAAAGACRRAGYLVPQSDGEPRHVKGERIGQRTVKAYVIRDAILGGEG